MAEIKQKKVSDLDSINANDIDNNDLLLVSDYNGGACISKKLTMDQLVKYIAASPSFKQMISAQAEATATTVATQVVDEQISAKTMDIVYENVNDIFDMYDGYKDNTMNIDAGGST